MHGIWRLALKDLRQLGVIDAVVPEPLGGAHRDPHTAAHNLEQYIAKTLRDLKRTIGIAPNLAAAGVKREQVPRLVEIASADICHQTNPRPVTAADFARLFAEAM